MEQADWTGAIGKGHNRPDGPQVSPKAWCYRRVKPLIDRGEFGNAYGSLRADLMRDRETVYLVDRLEKIRGFDEFCAFVDEHLKGD